MLKLVHLLDCNFDFLVIFFHFFHTFFNEIEMRNKKKSLVPWDSYPLYLFFFILLVLLLFFFFLCLCFKAMISVQVVSCPGAISLCMCDGAERTDYTDCLKTPPKLSMVNLQWVDSKKSTQKKKIKKSGEKNITKLQQKKKKVVAFKVLVMPSGHWFPSSPLTDITYLPFKSLFFRFLLFKCSLRHYKQYPLTDRSSLTKPWL